MYDFSDLDESGSGPMTGIKTYHKTSVEMFISVCWSSFTVVRIKNTSLELYVIYTQWIICVFMATLFYQM